MKEFDIILQQHQSDLIDRFIHDSKHCLDSMRIDISKLHEFKNEIKNEKQKRNFVFLINSLRERASELNRFQNHLIATKSSKNRNPVNFNVYDSVDLACNLLCIKHDIEYVIDTQETRINQFNIVGIKGLFQQVLYNVILNSIEAYSKYSSKKEIRIKIKSDNSNNLVIEINDSAGGIDKNTINKVFKLSYSTKNIEGSGYGLTISRKIIEDCFKGAINITSKIGEGTQVKIIIPK